MWLIAVVFASLVNGSHKESDTEVQHNNPFLSDYRTHFNLPNFLTIIICKINWFYDVLVE